MDLSATGHLAEVTQLKAQEVALGAKLEHSILQCKEENLDLRKELQQKKLGAKLLTSLLSKEKRLHQEDNDLAAENTKEIQDKDD